MFVRSAIKTKGHTSINLGTKVPIVNGDPVPGCLLHLTMRLHYTALWAGLNAMSGSDTISQMLITGSMTTFAQSPQAAELASL